jgi:hypothetical protein
MIMPPTCGKTQKFEPRYVKAWAAVRSELIYAY